MSKCFMNTNLRRVAAALLALIMTVSCLGFTAVSADAATVSETNVDRIYGDNRFHTALKAADEVAELLGVDKLDAVIVASGMNFADALAGSYLAVVKKAPILLAGGGNTAQLHTYIRDNVKPGGTVYILGGEAAVPAELEAGLTGFRAVRLSGADRFGTNLDILKETGTTGGEILVCTGTDFADSLSASAVGKPILLINNLAGSLSADQKAFLQSFGADKIYILGGVNAVSKALEAQLTAYGSVERIGGSNRFETSVMVAEKFFSEPRAAVLAYAMSYPDGLCGGLVANLQRGPMILTHNSSAQLARDYVQDCGIGTGSVMGGSGLISDDTVRFVFGTAQEQPEQPEGPEAPRVFNITYELNGGDHNPRNPDTYTPDERVVLYAPSREGFDFAGWYLESDFRTKVEEISPEQTGDITLYAKWSTDRYVITYVLDGGRNSARNPETYAPGETYVLQGASKSYNTFAGWYLESTYETRVTQIKATDTGDITLYAKWEPYTYTITYELNNGVNSEANPDVYAYGDGLVLADPTRENYDFYGWYLDKDFRTKIEQIPADRVGDITLYAKWHLAHMNINGEGMDDMIWSWWYYPQVVSTEDAVFWGYSTKEGYSGIAKYDIATGKTTKTHLKRLNTVDDHNGSAVTLLEDGRVVCIYAGGHNNNYELHVRVSGEPYSIESFDTNVVLESAGKTCYTQIIQYNGRIYIFYRINNNVWLYRSSEDCVNWTEETFLVRADRQYYCRFMPTTQDGLVRICMYANPDQYNKKEGAVDFRMGFLDLNTGKILNADAETVLGTEDVMYDNFTALLSPKTAGNTLRMFDVAITEPERPMILFTEFKMSASAMNSVYWLYDDGNLVEICPGGTPILSQKYQGGASFIGTDRIVLARNANNTDYIELYSYADGAVSLEREVWSEALGEAGIRNARPIVDVNGKYFLWHSGYYNLKSNKDFDTQAMLEPLN